MSSIVTSMKIDTARVQEAARLYNDVYDLITEAGWFEETEESPYWPNNAKPKGSWRHKNHPGSFSMSAAFMVYTINR